VTVLGMVRVADRTINRDPGHHLRVNEVLGAVPHLPYALIWVAPGSFDLLGQRCL
jgi:hypothetical protein